VRAASDEPLCGFPSAVQGLATCRYTENITIYARMNIQGTYLALSTVMCVSSRAILCRVLFI